MAQLLSQASALNPGHDLWVVPNTSASRWTMRLDWYLNFQSNKASRRTMAKPAQELSSTLEQIEWPAPVISAAEKSPLLIACDQRLPARWVAVVPFDSDLGEWSARIETLWRGLHRPSLKIFLPTGLQAGSFSELWKAEDMKDYSVVLDQDPLPR